MRVLPASVVTAAITTSEERCPECHPLGHLSLDPQLRRHCRRSLLDAQL